MGAEFVRALVLQVGLVVGSQLPTLRVFISLRYNLGFRAVSLRPCGAFGELLFFACTKKTNEKKVHRVRWSLCDYLRPSLLGGTGSTGLPDPCGPEMAVLAISASRASFLSIFKRGLRARARAEQEQGKGGAEREIGVLLTWFVGFC